MESTSAFPNLKKGGGNGKLLPLSSIPRFQPESTNSSGETHLEKCPIEEQLSWLDDLLNDSGTLFHRSGHRRSASDSCAHLGAAGTDESEFVNAYFAQNLTKSKDLDTTFSQTKESGDQVASSQKVDEAADKAAKTISGSKTELKRAKQQNAHRSRVRKLQYITHLERTVEILKAEGVGVSAELEFMEQQNMILTMENRALRQRLENISQEQMIKQWEQGMLEREIGRLQSLYHLQKQQKMHHQQHPKHRQTRSIDDHLNTCVSIKNKDDSLNAPIWV
ncbi:Basic-leucine zipper transcription factor family protein [Perilla frutescens var. hirtella]|nr:Basic-leucine zipper transcription factor family protein [Perilla frutescens var. hirtella]